MCMRMCMCMCMFMCRSCMDLLKVLLSIAMIMLNSSTTEKRMKL